MKEVITFFQLLLASLTFLASLSFIAEINSYSLLIFEPSVHRPVAMRAWFLEIAFVCDFDMCVSLCVCVRPRGYI